MELNIDQLRVREARQRLDLVQLRKALAHLLHLHGCEQEGLMPPTRDQWLEATEMASAAMIATGGMIYPEPEKPGEN